MPIRTDLQSLHPSVAGIRDGDGQLHIAKDMRRRALIVLQAVAAEHERKGFAVTDSSKCWRLVRERLLRHAEWEAAMAQAKRLAIEDRHFRVLRRNVETWRFAEDLREYVGELHGRLAKVAAHDDMSRAVA